MSMFAEYKLEREGIRTFEIEGKGFATYKEVEKGVVYIMDLYVKPEYRKDHIASTMADAIAKETEAKKLLGSVSPYTKGATASIQILISYGFKVSNCDNELIWFVKELK